MSDDEDESEYITCKIVLLGEVGVGKTSIISRYVSNTFSEDMMSTTGGSFATKKIIIDNNHKIKFQLWDTAGQERFRSLAKVFYQNAAAAILVYDITRKNSFDNIKSFWINEIKENAPSDIVLVIAGNKSDEYVLEQVSIQEGKNLAKEINAIFKTISAKLSHGIDEMFMSIAKKFADPKYIEASMNKEEEMEYRRKLIKKNHKKQKKKSCC